MMGMQTLPCFRSPNHGTIFDWRKLENRFFFINDQRGSLVNLNISMLPGHSSGGEGGLQSTISDVNQDGHIDVILFGLTAADNTDDIEILLLRDDLQLKTE
jgi:hypothetical protein